MSWSRSHSQLTTAHVDDVWARWATAEYWGPDDPDLEWATFDGPPAEGSGGLAKSNGSPAQRFTFDLLEPKRALTFSIKLPLAVLSFPHTMRETPDGLLVTHAVRLDGPLSWLFVALVGRKVAAGLPEVVRLVTRNALADGAKGRADA